MTSVTEQTWARVLLGILAILAIACAWCGVAVRYVAWAIFLFPYQRLRTRRRAAGQIGAHEHVKHANL